MYHQNVWRSLDETYQEDSMKHITHIKPGLGGHQAHIRPERTIRTGTAKPITRRKKLDFPTMLRSFSRWKAAPSANDSPIIFMTARTALPLLHSTSQRLKIKPDALYTAFPTFTAQYKGSPLEGIPPAGCDGSTIYTPGTKRMLPLISLTAPERRDGTAYI